MFLSCISTETNHLYVYELFLKMNHSVTGVLILNGDLHGTVWDLFKKESRGVT